jgi:hypothetical protein
MILMVALFATTTFAQREIRRVNVGDKTEVQLDSTYTINGELKGVYYKVYDLTPRLIDQRFIERKEVDQVLRQLELERRYQVYVVKQKRAFITDSLKQSDNLMSADEMIRADMDVNRLINEINLWKKVADLFKADKK